MINIYFTSLCFILILFPYNNCIIFVLIITRAYTQINPFVPSLFIIINNVILLFKYMYFNVCEICIRTRDRTMRYVLIARKIECY